MFIKPRFRIVPDGTRIQFMKGRFMGLIVSAILSTASVVLFFHPGLNLGIDFSGGVVMEVRTPGPANFGKIRAALADVHVPPTGGAALRRSVRGTDPPGCAGLGEGHPDRDQRRPRQPGEARARHR